jgi:hypothetical protein
MEYIRTHKRKVIAAVVILLLIAVVVLAPSKEDPALSSTASEPIVALEGNIVLSKNEMWPSKTVVNTRTEYRPTTNPSVVDTYCVNFFEDESYSYEFIGRADVVAKNVKCR